MQAVLTTLGSGEQDGDNAAARRAVAQGKRLDTLVWHKRMWTMPHVSDKGTPPPSLLTAALTPPPPAAGGGKEAFYTPLPAAQTGTPVDEWHSILTTLTGDVKTRTPKAVRACSACVGCSSDTPV
jgi:hypothetical protein